MKEWKERTGVPAAPVVVQCADAITQCGLFCTCYVVCEKMTLEGHVSMFQTVKSLRLKQPGVIASLVNHDSLLLFVVVRRYLEAAAPRVKKRHVRLNSGSTGELGRGAWRGIPSG